MHESTMKPRGAGARQRENSLTSTESLSKVQINLWHRAACSRMLLHLLSSSPNPKSPCPWGNHHPCRCPGSSWMWHSVLWCSDKVGISCRLDLIWEVSSNFQNSGIQQLFSTGVFSWEGCCSPAPPWTRSPSWNPILPLPAFLRDLNPLHSHNINPSAAIPGQSGTLA